MPSLQAKIFLVFALTATVPLTALSYLALAETRAALTTEVGATHEDTAKAAAAFAGAFVENGAGFVGSLATRGALVRAAAANDSGAATAELTSFRARSTYEGTPVFDGILLLDARGRVLAADPAGLVPLGADLSGGDAFRAASNATSAVVLRVPPGPGEPTLPIASAVPDANGTRVGVLVASVSLQRLGAELQAFAHGTGEGIVVTDPTGRLLVAPDRALLTSQPDWSAVEPVRLALAGHSDYVVFTDATSEQDTLAGYALVAPLHWAVVDQIPTAEAYAALTRLTAVLIVLSGILVGGILLASVILARRIVSPVRELTTAAGALSSGQLQTRIEVQGRDEIAELGMAFNDMAARIRESLEGLRASEARYRNLVESANDFILTIEPDGNVSFAGPLAERILMRDVGDLQGRPVASLVMPADRPRVDYAVKSVLERGEPVQWVLHGVVSRDGSTRLLRSNFSPVFGKDGSVQRVLVVASDITSERRQERFRDASFQMARLVSEESTLETIAEKGLGVALAAGPFLRGALYITTGDKLREMASASMGPSDAPWDRAATRRLAEQAVGTRTTVRDRDVVAVPLLERGEALGALVVESHDRQSEDALPTLASQLGVGIRRSLFEGRLKEYASELESRVEERTAELHAKNEEMEQFLYSVSHDLKAPLISIEGYAEALDEEFGRAITGDGKLYLERIRKNATLMESLILDILELSRIGRVRENAETIDMDRLVADVKARFEERLRQEGGSMVVQPGLPALRGERHRVEQLLNNLVENAIKYRHPSRAPVVRIEGERTALGATFRVIDNGRGIPPGSEDQLFKIFHRLPTPDGMSDPGGTGMGLAIVKRIVETHGGTVTASSMLGEGTVFTIAFPSEPKPTSPPRAPRAPALRRACAERGPVRILVVDDKRRVAAARHAAARRARAPRRVVDDEEPVR
jgi:PAS domain S-box-containing protein